MIRYILAAIAILAGLAGIGYVVQSHKVTTYGVFDGVGVAYEGHYFLIEGRAVKTPVNATILYGKFVLWGGYLLNGTEVKPKHVMGAWVAGDVVVVSGGFQVLVGEAHKIGNYTVVTGNPARVLIIDGYLYYPK